MLIDINTYIGHWPFRQVNSNTAAELVNLMDNSGIDIAAVSSINSIFYRDPNQGNIELLEQIANYRERFIPLAVINPAYQGWKKDFLNCIEHLGMKGLVLYPYYHQYKLTDSNAIELLKLAAEKKIPVHLPCAIENIRQRHWLDTTENLSIPEVNQVLKLCPDTDFIITNGPVSNIASQLKEICSSRSGRVYYDFTRIDVFNPDFEKLIEIAGTDRIVFGSVLPLQYAAPQLVKLDYLRISDIDKEKIMSGNLKELFNL